MNPGSLIVIGVFNNHNSIHFIHQQRVSIGLSQKKEGTTIGDIKSAYR